MKKINCNDWAPRNKPVPYEEVAPIPITNPLIKPSYFLFVFSNAGGVAWAYYNLSWFTKNYHYFYADD